MVGRWYVRGWDRSPPTVIPTEATQFFLPISLPVRWLGCAVEGPLLSSPSTKGALCSLWEPGSWACLFRLGSRADGGREMRNIARINARKKFCANDVIPAYEAYFKRVLSES